MTRSWPETQTREAVGLGRAASVCLPTREAFRKLPQSSCFHQNVQWRLRTLAPTPEGQGRVSSSRPSGMRHPPPAPQKMQGNFQDP